jgi:hypothetical protein
MLIGQLLIQVQPELAPSLSLSAFKSRCEAVASDISGITEYQCEEGHENGPFLNLHFAASDPIAVWSHIRQALYENADFGDALKAASMAMCTGEAGWTDYVLLYHYDPNVACVPIYTP